jgi:truncated hemoglobin YjbI
MTSPTASYERIGGEAVAQAALDDFFQRAQQDDMLAHLIGPVITPGARAFVAAALDLDNHDEAMLAPALAWLSEEGLEDDDLDHMVGYLVLALEAQGLDDELVAEVADHAEALRDAALGVWPEDGDEDEDEVAA